MQDAEICRLLDEIQSDIDGEHEAFARRDFECKLEHHRNIKPLLGKRDGLVRRAVECYWARALANYRPGAALLPVDALGRPDTRWLRSLEVDYLPEYGYRVHMELNENEFVQNTALTKKAYLGRRDVERSGVRWKGDLRCAVLGFFETDTQDLDIFDILYELYVNSAFYFLKSP
ncbi:nucleosome assembly protein [Encephalitozoon intestinalis]|nr:nucleosome assembly protein [Encephalitozoon intestinalis]UTX44634.1 nucleosome assembly protein [Encephalitozoon intestinalis]UTX45719.1 nucleosome assembly protein [Encephalitozoon intestinalis]